MYFLLLLSLFVFIHSYFPARLPDPLLARALVLCQSSQVWCVVVSLFIHSFIHSSQSLLLLVALRCFLKQLYAITETFECRLFDAAVDELSRFLTRCRRCQSYLPTETASKTADVKAVRRDDVEWDIAYITDSEIASKLISIKFDFHASQFLRKRQLYPWSLRDVGSLFAC